MRTLIAMMDMMTMMTIAITISLDMYTIPGWISCIVGLIALVLFLPGIFQVIITIVIIINIYMLFDFVLCLQGIEVEVVIAIITLTVIILINNLIVNVVNDSDAL